jgi:hypothetical protein
MLDSALANEKTAKLKLQSDNDWVMLSDQALAEATSGVPGACPL